MSRSIPLSTLALALAGLSACQEPIPAASPPSRAALSQRPAAARPVAAALPAPSGDPGSAGFHEAPAQRDPFRRFATTVEPPPPPSADSQLLGETPIGDLRLLAVVDSSQGPAAMVTDATGFGTTLHRGVYVGRREVVRDQDVDYGVRWRVARITPSRLQRSPDGELSEAPAEVVFERADPTGRVLPMERTLTLTPPARARMPGSFRMASAEPGRRSGR